MRHQSREPDLPVRRYARRMRHEPTPAEKALWSMLRDRSLSRWKFRRQHPIGFFVLDFYCPRLALAIELDGAGHFDDAGAAGDAQRTAALGELGVEVLRFENAEVLECSERVLGKVRDVIAAIEASRSG